MSTRRLITFLAIGLAATACSDQSPTAVEDRPYQEPAQFNHNPGHQTGALSGIPVTGDLADGSGTFSGVLNITSLAFQNGQLLASGTLVGTATQGGVVTQITQTFTNTVIDLISSAGVCRILLLEIPGGLQLDLLGLVVDLAPVQLEIRAESGPGNLLGNLLCALVGLLDQGGPLSGILNLLNQINTLL